MPSRTRSTQVKIEGESEPTTDDDAQWHTPALDDKHIRMTYNIARGEQGVLTFEPYKVS